MQATLCYSQRLSSPFQGALQVIPTPGGKAESRDSLNWALSVMDERLMTQMDLSKVHFDTRNLHNDFDRVQICSASGAGLIERTGHALFEAIERMAACCFRLYPTAFDDESLPIARVKAGLMQGSQSQQRHHEPFYQFFK